MPLPVRLREIIDHMEMASEEMTAYINRATGEVVSLTHEELQIVEDEEPLDDLPAWQKEVLPKVREVLDSTEFLPLPGKFEIHEWSIMAEFARSRADPTESNALSAAIHGTGAFRMFRHVLDDLDLREEWFRFRDAAFEQIAVDFLDSHNIPFTAHEK